MKPENLLHDTRGINEKFVKWFNDGRYILKEEEASIINQFMNSFKLKKQEKQGYSTSDAKKTMKQLIAESQMEVETKKEKLKTVLDWSSMANVIS